LPNYKATPINPEDPPPCIPRNRGPRPRTLPLPPSSVRSLSSAFLPADDRVSLQRCFLVAKTPRFLGRTSPPELTRFLEETPNRGGIQTNQGDLLKENPTIKVVSALPGSLSAFPNRLSSLKKRPADFSEPERSCLQSPSTFLCPASDSAGMGCGFFRSAKTLFWSIPPSPHFAGFYRSLRA